MAVDKPEQPEGPAGQGPLSELDRFLTRFVELTAQVSKGMLAQSTDADEKELIAAYAKPLNSQVAQLSDYLRQRARSASAQVIEDIGTVLRLTAADALTEGGMRVAKNLASQKAKIGISDIIALIKKIILAIAEMLHINLPDWFHALLELIDEIINFLLSIGLLKLASALSKRHQDYMAELTQMKRLQRASAWRSNTEDQDDE